MSTPARIEALDVDGTWRNHIVTPNGAPQFSPIAVNQIEIEIEHISEEVGYSLRQRQRGMLNVLHGLIDSRFCHAREFDEGKDIVQRSIKESRRL